MPLRAPRLLIALGLLALLLAGGLLLYLQTGEKPSAESPPPDAPPPRLVVLVVFDQMRGDYLTRWEKLFGEGGFRRLQRDGASFANCHYPYAYTATAPGHASLVTGCSPMTHGIIANGWYDRLSGQEIVAVRTPRHQLVPAVGDPGKTPGASPERRKAPTVGESLHRATNGKGKVVSLSIKDRAAVLLAALLASICYWFHPATGDFVTSTYYADRPHAWVKDFNAARAADRWFQTEWTRLRPELDYAPHSGRDDVHEEGTGVKQGRTFPHPMNGGLEKVGRAYYDAVVNSPFGNEHLLELAKKAIDAERLGQRDVPDLLCLSFSSNDVVGHCWGPDSQEVLDVTLRSDRIVEELLDYLDAKVGKGRYLLVLTSDHGVCPLPAVARGQGKDAGRVDGDTLASRARRFLDEAYPLGKGGARWFESGEGGWLYLNRSLLRDRGLQSADVERTLAAWLGKQQGVLTAYTRSQLTQGPLKDDPLGDSVRRSFHPDCSGEIMIVLKPYHLFSPAIATGTDHGSPHDYDAHVPLLVYGPGIQPGVRGERVSPLAVAAILSRALGVPPPEAAEVGVPESLRR